MEFRKRKAITFLEIVMAVAIMAVAMIPIFGLISRQTVETDKNASQVFAINKATEVLNSALDNLPFVTLREGNPGYIKVSDLPQNHRYEGLTSNWAKKMASLLFNNSLEEPNGYQCRGVVKDSKGISYLIHLKIEDVPSIIRRNKPERLEIGENYPDSDPKEFTEPTETVFSFLKNPSMLSSSNWIQDFAENIDETGKPLTELELPGSGVSESPTNFYTDEGINNLKGSTKYSYLNPTAERFTAKMVMKKVPYETEESLAWCPFKKLIVQVQWNLEQQYYSDPESEKGNIQRIHLMAIKGDID